MITANPPGARVNRAVHNLEFRLTQAKEFRGRDDIDGAVFWAKRAMLSVKRLPTLTVADRHLLEGVLMDAMDASPKPPGDELNSILISLIQFEADERANGGNHAAHN